MLTCDIVPTEGRESDQNQALYQCTSLTAIEVDALNPVYRSVEGVLLNQGETRLIKCPGGKVGPHTVPSSVTIIGNNVFSVGTSRTHVTIPESVIGIGSFAFANCSSLTEVFFNGNAPSLGSSGLAGDDNATVYYLPDATDWGTAFGDRPTALWQPQIESNDASFGVRTNQFGFNLAWTSGQVVVVEACTNLAHPGWAPLQTKPLTNDSCYFSDPQWTNYPGRFYHVRSN
jgi:hypothetical protein